MKPRFAMHSSIITLSFLLALLALPLTASPTQHASAARVNGTTLTATVTAAGYWTQTWQYPWTIEKTVDQPSVTVTSGTQQVNYTVKLYHGDPTKLTDITGVTGQICATNGGAVATVGLTNTDTVQGKTTGGQFPNISSINVPMGGELAAGASACYPYDLQFTPQAGLIYRTSAQITITNHSNYIGQPFGPNPKADFALPAQPSATYLDVYANVSDSYAGSLGQVNANSTFTYSRTFACDSTGGSYDNIASVVGVDTATTLTASASVAVTVNCLGDPLGDDPNCTLTQGYWGTHSIYGPANYNQTWAQVGEDTAFFSSGATRYQAVTTDPVDGNAYWILANQYVAAYLNSLYGADTSALGTALTDAATLLSSYGPYDTLSDDVRAEFIAVKDVLDSFNNGYIGPGHCA